MSTNSLLLQNGEDFKFSDISLAVIKSPTCIVLANSSTRMAVATMSIFLFACNFGNHVKNLIVEANLAPLDWLNLICKLERLENLYLSSENLPALAMLKRAKVLWKLKKLHILQNYSVDISIGYRSLPLDFENLLRFTLTEIHLGGIQINQKLAATLFKLPHLQLLNMLGAYVNSSLAADFQQNLKSSSLLEISLPPTWFSFSSRNSYTNSDIKQHNFSSWLDVAKIGLFVNFYDPDIFWTQLKEMMPKRLKKLELYGNCWSLKRSSQLKEWHKFDIEFGSDVTQQLFFSNYGSSDLISKIIHKPAAVNHDASSFWVRYPTQWQVFLPSDIETELEELRAFGYHPREVPNRPTPMPSREDVNLEVLRRATELNRRRRRVSAPTLPFSRRESTIDGRQFPPPLPFTHPRDPPDLPTPVPSRENLYLESARPTDGHRRRNRSSSTPYRPSAI